MRASRPLGSALLLTLLASLLAVLPAAAQGTPTINEIHYDNAGTDVGEFVEVAAPAGTDLAGWTIVLYNGANGLVYDTDPVGEVDGSADGVAFHVVQYPVNGLQNGAPDGLALVDPAGVVVEFLSYEGTLTAVDGPAAGTTSTDIGVSEAGNEPAGRSLQRTAPGETTWFGPSAETRGGANEVIVAPAPECDPDADLTLISEIQGDGAVSPLATGTPVFREGETVTVEAVVTITAPGLSAVFLQEEPIDDDGDPSTSEGVFVFTGPAVAADLQPGQVVQVTGAVTEDFGRTQIGSRGNGPVDSVAVCPADAVTIAPTALPLPSDDAVRETFEGMLISADQLLVADTFEAYSFGELVTGYREILRTPTDVAPPGGGSAAVAARNRTLELRIDDLSGARVNRRLPYATDELRVGARVAVAGVLDFGFGNWKVQPTADPLIDHIPLDEVPSLDGGNDVVAFNVLNYFNTFGDTAVLRGARSPAQFEIQSAKIVSAIVEMDAAVVGLVEIENDYEDLYDDDPSTVPSAQTLVEEINVIAGEGTYDWIRIPEPLLTDVGLGGGGLGTDAIAQGIIYQPDRAMPLGGPATFDIDAGLYEVEDGERIDSFKTRWPLAQAFRIDGEVFTAVVNHFKSKGSSCEDVGSDGALVFEPGEDVDDDSTTASCDLVRRNAALELTNWLATDPTGVGDDDRDTLLLGDFNSYAEEAPIQILQDAGYVDLVRLLDDNAFTYKFSGRVGRLDYAFASTGLADRVAGTEVWQINSRAQYADLYFIDPIDLTGPEGSSDHDPVIVGLDGRGRADEAPGRPDRPGRH